MMSAALQVAGCVRSSTGMSSKVLVVALLIAAALACECGGNAFGEVPLKFSREVQDARLQGRAVVALESTIISHGTCKGVTLREHVVKERSDEMLVDRVTMESRGRSCALL